MSDKESKKEDSIKLKKPTQISLEMGLINEQATKNSSEITSYGFDGGYKVNNFSLSINGDNTLESENFKIKVDYQDDAVFMKDFTLDDMREQFGEGKSVSDIVSKMRDFIIDSKETNPDNIQRAVSALLGSVEELYDHCIHEYGLNVLAKQEGYHRENLGNSSEEILTKILNTPEREELHGFVCSTIADFGMKLLDECGIKSALLCGGTDTSNHTTLLWQRADGKYVQNNYGKSFTIDATNMKDAAREVYKHDLGLINNGYMYFVDDKGSYQEFNMKEEAVWGDELDKRDYNNETLFSHNIASQPSINAKVNYSVTGSVSAEVKGTLAYGNSDTSKETSFSLAYKKSGETALADNSQSIGAKIEHLGERIKQSGKTFFGTKVVVDYTKLTTDFLKNKRNYFNCAKSKYIKGEEFVNKLNELLSEMYNNYSKIILTEAEYIENYINDSTCDGIPVRELSDENLKNQLLEEITAIATESYKEYKQDILTEDQFIQNTMSSVLNFNALLGDTDCVDSEQFETTNLTAFVRKYFGGEKTLLKDDGIELSTGYQLSGLLGLNAVTSSEFVFGGDLRLAAEEGLKLSINNKTNHFGTEVSGGVVADFALKNGTLTPTVSPGIKLNASTEYQTKIADNAMLGAKLSGYSTVTRPSSDYGLSGQLQSVYKLKNSDITIFSSVNCGVDKQQLTIGQFNEQTENIISYGASVGAQIGKNTTVGLNYNKSDNKLNPTRNREQISVMARVNL